MSDLTAEGRKQLAKQANELRQLANNVRAAADKSNDLRDPFISEALDYAEGLEHAEGLEDRIRKEIDDYTESYNRPAGSHHHPGARVHLLSASLALVQATKHSSIENSTNFPIHAKNVKRELAAFHECQDNLES